MTSGLMLISRLKAGYGKFYKKLKKPIWFATILLSVTLLIRACLDIVRYIDQSGLDNAIDESIENNTVLAPLYDSAFFLFSDLIPIMA